MGARRGTARWLSAGVLLAALLVGAGAWWLHGGDAARDLAAKSPLARAPIPGTSVAPPAVLPPTPTPAPQPLALAPDSPAPSAAGDESANTPDAPPPSESLARMHGRVLDHRGQPLRGATIVYWPQPSSLGLHGLTSESWGPQLDVLPRVPSGADGRFVLDGRVADPPAGAPKEHALRIAVLAAGLATVSRSITVPVGKACDFGDLTLEPGGWLAGRVVDDRGTPVAGAEVLGITNQVDSLTPGLSDSPAAAEAAGPFASVFTGADGRFHVGPLWNGDAALRFSADGLRRLWRRQVGVRAGEVRELDDLVMYTTAAFVGRVVDEDGAPVVGAHVVATYGEFLEPRMPGEETSPREANWARSARGVSTEADGSFQLADQPRTAHRLYVIADGFEPLHANEQWPGSPAVTLVVVRQAVLHLRLLEAETMQPVTGAQVEVTRGEPGRAVGTDLLVEAGAEPGRHVVAGVGADELDVRITAPGRVQIWTQVAGVAPPGSAERELLIPRESVISGRVTDEAGNPPPGAWLEVGHPDAFAVCDEQGRYTLRGLAAGSLWVVAASPRHAAAWREVSVSPDAPAIGVDFVLRCWATLYGRVAHEDGSPWSDEQVSLRRLGDESGRERGVLLATNDEGEFELDQLPAGTWMLGEPFHLSLVLEPGEKRELLLRAPPATRITGLVLDAEGNPLAEALVSISSLGADGRYGDQVSLRCDEEGRFWCDGEPGTVALLAGSSAGGLSPLVVAQVLPGKDTWVELRLAAVSVELRLRDAASGMPIPHVGVSLMPLLADGTHALAPPARRSGLPVNVSAISDDHGIARFSGIAPGLYLVQGGGDRCVAPTHDRVSVVAGGAAVFELELVRRATIRGVVELEQVLDPTSRIRVHLMTPDGVMEQSAKVEGGRFELAGVTPGSFQLSIVSLHMAQKAMELVHQPHVLAEQAVTLEPGQVLDVVLPASD